MTPTDITDSTPSERVPWGTLIDALAESNQRALELQDEMRTLRTTVMVALGILAATIYFYERAAG